MPYTKLNAIAIARRTYVGLLLGTSLFDNAQAQSRSDQARVKEIVRPFCHPKRQWESYKRYASPALRELDRQAQALIEAGTKKHPDDKPIWSDGVPLSSSRGDAAVCRLKRIRPMGRGLGVELNYFLLGEKKAEKKIAWTDRLRLVKGEGGMWKIDNILFGKPHA